MKRDLTIGEVAERAGVTVKTVRFYSDAGLLPTAGRSESNYRLYTLGDVVQVALIRSLREAGFAIREIRAVLARDLPLAEALRVRLAAVEAQIRALRPVASATSRISAALSRPRSVSHREPSKQTLVRFPISRSNRYSGP